MNPDLIQQAKDGAARARVIADALGSANPVACAAAALAAECLEVSVAPFAWQSSHEIVRDLGVVPLRDSLLRDCARALQLASDGVRRLGIHGASASRSEAMVVGLEHVASAIVRASGGLDVCEKAIVERIAEPRLAEIALERRCASLQLEPNQQLIRLGRLSKDVERALIASAEARAEVASLEEKHSNAVEQTQLLTHERERLEVEIGRLRREVQSLDATVRRLEQDRHGSENDRACAADRRTRVRGELNALQNDPRDHIREAVARALRELPDDALDRSVRNAHVR